MDAERDRGNGEGSDDEDVRAGAFRRPSGSFRFDTLDRSRIEPRRLSVLVLSFMSS